MKVFLLIMLVMGVLGLNKGCFYNVVAENGADPSIVRHTDGYYYATKTTGGNIQIWRSRSISGLYAGDNSPDTKVVWTPPPSGPYSKNIWAPELQYINGAWYIYFAADDGDNKNHRMYALENKSPDPFQDKWEFKGKIADPTDRWAIDGMVLQNGDDLYFIWSGWEGEENVAQNLYIAPMSDPLTISGDRVLISTPTYNWETNTFPMVNEGPEIIIRNNTINLVYSASGSWTDTYCLGLITADTSSNLLYPASWKKHDQPVFASANGIYGPGHHTFTKSPDGTEDWIVYHSAKRQGSGWDRLIRAQKFTWNEDDTPNFGKPAPPNQPIPLPSGDPERFVYEAENAEISHGEMVELEEASGNKAVGHLDTDKGSITFTVEVPETDDYNMSIRYDNGSPNNLTAIQQLSVNGVPVKDIRYINSGWGNWNQHYTRVFLLEGTNTITLTPKAQQVRIDRVDIFPR